MRARTAVRDVAPGERDAVVDQGPQGLGACLRQVGEQPAQRRESLLQAARAALEGAEVVLVAGEHVAALAGLDVLQRGKHLGGQQQAIARARARVGDGLELAQAGVAGPGQGHEQPETEQQQQCRCGQCETLANDRRHR